jgi:iron(III) transport system ATP-binding protein
VIAEVYGHPVKVLSEKETTGKAEIVLRPEAIEITDRGQLPCKVELGCFMGSYQNYHVRVGDTLVKIADNCPIGRKTYRVGDEACISFRSECAHLLST